MVYRTYKPSPPLTYFVQNIWYFAGYRPLEPTELRMPDGTASITFQLNGKVVRLADREAGGALRSFGRAVAGGSRSEYFRMDTGNESTMLGIQFQPSGALPFLKYPGQELHNTLLPLADLWGSDAAELLDRLLEAETPECMFAVTEQFLLNHLNGSMERHPSIEFFLRQADSAAINSVAEIVGQIGMSQRRFIELFKINCGMTPKAFLRVRRFQDALRLAASPGFQGNWTEVAIACGYFDQSHFNHDFRAFSGITPGEYRTLRGPFRNHVPIREGG
ncbi:helix-turn-helix transcriptional regulator [Paenibacillus doosanensis]|uniref:Transcriptional activator FtrA n=1 Tax=Paenibacillus konkukensis TaxID=2020716 RepID=A0ABY4S2H0_9BACL|nr:MULTISPECIES: helix-turn-helix transcriptional regulator [Paenibacillus]MCS7460384.1 helix-turn-helix transcriptional regulator [Paenibacillus doosanensis]UQZ87434.1 transcriptional activator FtrA [Paenibacillus konkukensis]